MCLAKTLPVVIPVFDDADRVGEMLRRVRACGYPAQGYYVIGNSFMGGPEASPFNYANDFTFPIVGKADEEAPESAEYMFENGTAYKADELWVNGHWFPLHDFVTGLPTVGSGTISFEYKPTPGGLFGVQITRVGTNDVRTSSLGVLAPVEVVQEGYPTKGGIRFSKWSNAFPNDTFDPNFVETDPDRFRIRVPAFVAGLSKMTISSKGIQGAVVDGSFDGIYCSEYIVGHYIRKWLECCYIFKNSKVKWKTIRT